MSEPIKVLAVDDEDYMLKILKACLPSPTFTLTTCSDAMAAMSVFRGGQFDIIMLDVVMPGINGFELHTLIRNVNTEVPIIMLTAKIDDINRTMLNKISSDKNTYYQSKSFKKDELTSRIITLVSEQQVATERKNYFEEMERDIALAGDVQRTMFPHWDTQYSDLRSCFYYRPYMKITGDLYTITRINDGLYLSVIGDISGHGIQAALCMSAMEFAISKYIHTTSSADLSPHGLLNYLQSFMSGIVSERYMTAIVSIIDLKANTITFQNAGHPDFVMFTPSKGGIIDANPEKIGSLPISIINNHVYLPDQTLTIDFPEDAIIFVYTDGLTDLQNSLGETYDINPFDDFLSAFSKDGLTAALDYKIMDAMFKIGFDKIKDDIAIASISRYNPRTKIFDFTLKPTIADVDAFALKVCNLTTEMTGRETLGAKVEILLSEFLNNVVVHGLDNKNAQRPIISAHIEYTNEEVTLAFYDKGKRWDMQTNSTDDNISDILNYTRATSGRGLALIKKITSTIRRTRYAEELNETIFVVKNED